MKIDHDE